MQQPRDQRRAGPAAVRVGRAELWAALSRLGAALRSDDADDDPTARRALAEAAERYSSARWRYAQAHTGPEIAAVHAIVAEGERLADLARGRPGPPPGPQPQVERAPASARRRPRWWGFLMRGVRRMRRLWVRAGAWLRRWAPRSRRHELAVRHVTARAELSRIAAAILAAPPADGAVVRPSAGSGSPPPQPAHVVSGGAGGRRAPRCAESVRCQAVANAARWYTEALDALAGARTEQDLARVDRTVGLALSELARAGA